MIEIKVKKIKEISKTPQKNHSSDAGWDLFSVENIIIPKQSRAIISTGISTEIPEGYCALIWDRSSMGSKGFHRFAGVIDCSYRGEWKVILCNFSQTNHEIKSGDKIAQAIIQKVEDVLFIEVDELSDTERGKKGFGSSGR